MVASRITITIPASLVEQADREAERLGRSRSWIIANAVRRYLGSDTQGSVVHETAAPPYSTGLGTQRLAQLRADLRLTPEQRVQEAERTVQAAPSPRHRRGGASYERTTRMIGFERYEDYLEYKRHEDTGRGGSTRRARPRFARRSMGAAPGTSSWALPPCSAGGPPASREMWIF